MVGSDWSLPSSDLMVKVLNVWELLWMVVIRMHVEMSWVSRLQLLAGIGVSWLLTLRTVWVIGCRRMQRWLRRESIGMP